MEIPQGSEISREESASKLDKIDGANKNTGIRKCPVDSEIIEKVDVKEDNLVESEQHSL